MNESEFKLIVVSSPDIFLGEGAVINELFDSGLQCFHLRKPNSTDEEIQLLIDDISFGFHDRIVLHHKADLAEDNNFKRLHINYSFFKANDLPREKFKLSCSVHSWEEYRGVKNSMEYVFISPVFDSISKPYYKAETELHEIPVNKGAEIIALGGINSDNLLRAKEIGFDGVAVLGMIWENPLKAKEKFLELKALLQNQIA